MTTVTLARHAMATRFELVLHGHDSPALRAAGEAALDEIDRLENRLSLYRPTSEIAHINARAAAEPVQVSPEVFALLQHAALLSSETGGAFDITIAPLVRSWGFMGDHGRQPSPDEIAVARSLVGMNHVLLDSSSRTVHFTKPGVMLDLGAIGKGYAVERAAEILREAGVRHALIHGGTSTTSAIGSPPDSDAWKIAVELPSDLRSQYPDFATRNIFLRDESLSVSAVWGRTFESCGKRFGHVIDPRTGSPVEASLMSAVVLPSATETDALSTALLTLGVPGLDLLTTLRPGIRSLLLTEESGKLTQSARGLDAA